MDSFVIKKGFDPKEYKEFIERGNQDHALRAQRDMIDGEEVVILFRQQGTEGKLERLKNAWLAKEQKQLATAYVLSLNDVLRSERPVVGDINARHGRAYQYQQTLKSVDVGDAKWQKQLYELQTEIDKYVAGNDPCWTLAKVKGSNRTLKLKPEILRDMVSKSVQTHLGALSGDRLWKYFDDRMNRFQSEIPEAGSMGFLVSMTQKCLEQHFKEHPDASKQVGQEFLRRQIGKCIKGYTSEGWFGEWFDFRLEQLERVAQRLDIKPKDLQKMLFDSMQAHMKGLSGDALWKYFGDAFKYLNQKKYGDDYQELSRHLREQFALHPDAKNGNVTENLPAYLQLLIDAQRPDLADLAAKIEDKIFLQCGEKLEELSNKAQTDNTDKAWKAWKAYRSAMMDSGLSEGFLEQHSLPTLVDVEKRLR